MIWFLSSLRCHQTRENICKCGNGKYTIYRWFSYASIHFGDFPAMFDDTGGYPPVAPADFPGFGHQERSAFRRERAGKAPGTPRQAGDRPIHHGHVDYSEYYPKRLFFDVFCDGEADEKPWETMEFWWLCPTFCREQNLGEISDKLQTRCRSMIYRGSNATTSFSLPRPFPTLPPWFPQVTSSGIFSQNQRLKLRVLMCCSFVHFHVYIVYDDKSIQSLYIWYINIYKHD